MIDLHIHSVYSDGSEKPLDILRLAETVGIKLLSITDHNTVAAYRELQKDDMRKVYSGDLITGVELSTVLFGQVVEILGYGFEPAMLGSFIRKAYGDQEDYMQRELRLIYSAYQRLGVQLDRQVSEFSVKEHGSAKKFIYQDLKQEKNRQFYLVDSNQSTFKGFIRGEIYNPESMLYVDYSQLLPSPAEIVDAIHQAGGTTFLAHPFQYTDTVWNHLDKVLSEVPLDGIEVWYSGSSDEQVLYLQEFCKREKLLMSGGSDFHGKNRPKVVLGNSQIDPASVQHWTMRYLDK